MDELIALFEKYKIRINSTGLGGNVYLERYGLVIPFNQIRLFETPPKLVVREIIGRFTKHPKYIEQTRKYVDSLIKKPIPLPESTTVVEVKPVVLTIDEKKKLIREKLIKEGLLNKVEI